MKKYRLKDFTGGWYLGDFYPTVLKTDAVEVAFKHHKKGEEWPRHAQKVAIEVNYIVAGMLKMNGVLCRKGDIIVVDPGEFIKPIFLSDVKVVVVKIPSLPSDKILG